MSAARYWRVTRIETYQPGPLELSELALFEGAVRVDSSATVSSTVEPTSGTLANLSDANFSTSTVWPESAVFLPGFAIVYDFGAGSPNISALSMAGPSESGLPLRIALERSTNGSAWTLDAEYFSGAYSGSSALTTYSTASGSTPLRVISDTGAAIIVGEPPVEDVAPRLLLPGRIDIDLQDGGLGRIIGTVKEKSLPVNTPLERRVVLVHQKDNRIIRETWSDPTTGAYEFRDIKLGERYAVISYDYAGTYRAVIADNLQAEPMP